MLYPQPMDTEETFIHLIYGTPRCDSSGVFFSPHSPRRISHFLYSSRSVNLKASTCLRNTHWDMRMLIQQSCAHLLHLPSKA